MKTAYRLADIETIGNQGDYRHQADEFLRLTGSTLQVRYLRTGLYFDETDEKQVRDIYEFKLSKGEREYIDTFGDSLQNTWDRYSAHVPSGDRYKISEHTFKALYLARLPNNAFPWRSLMGEISTRKRYAKENTQLSTWEYSRLKPSAYSILAGMQTYDVGSFDDFLAEFGYKIDSKESYENAQRRYEAVQNQYHKLQTLYSDKELQALATIA